MVRTTDPSRDLVYLALGYAVLAVGAALLGVIALDRPTLRGGSTSTVWLAAFGAVPWLLAAAVTAWLARRDGVVVPGLVITLVLLAAWAVAAFVAARGGAAEGGFAVPLLLSGIPTGLLLVMLVQLARRV